MKGESRKKVWLAVCVEVSAGTTINTRIKELG